MPCLLRNSPRTRVPCRPALLEGLKRELPPKYTIKGGPRGGDCGTVGYGSFHPAAAPTLTRMAYRHAAHTPSACCNVELSHAALTACMPQTEPPPAAHPLPCSGHPSGLPKVQLDPRIHRFWHGRPVWRARRVSWAQLRCSFGCLGAHSLHFWRLLLSCKLPCFPAVQCPAPCAFHVELILARFCPGCAPKQGRRLDCGGLRPRRHDAHLQGELPWF